jgi:hypothetical protein
MTKKRVSKAGGAQAQGQLREEVEQLRLQVDEARKWMGEMYLWALDVDQHVAGLGRKPPKPPGWGGTRKGASGPRQVPQ